MFLLYLFLEKDEKIKVNWERGDEKKIFRSDSERTRVKEFFESSQFYLRMRGVS